MPKVILSRKETISARYVNKLIDADASHRLHNPELTQEQNVQIYGKCNNPNGHGHNYEIEVFVKGEVVPFSLSLTDHR
jgi:6-pyruvoyltetrahydropterin/6-carboxytetrahydropterin synthase